MASYHQGFYRPINPQKYDGDPTQIVYRSSWELKLMRWLDLKSSVVSWASESDPIWYQNPIKGRPARYFPDFRVKIRNKDGVVETWIVEVKPKKETVPPKKRASQKYLREVATYAVNVRKWEAARRACQKMGWRFKILTEEDLAV